MRLYYSILVIHVVILSWTKSNNYAKDFPDVQPTEYQVKAAFLFNFAKFVDWPSETFKNEDSPLIIGIVGPNPFGNDLNDVINNKKVKHRNIIIKHFRYFKNIEFCHILFFNSSEKTRIKRILNRIEKLSILTVGDEIEGFIEKGGVINFIMMDNKIRFQINDEAAKQANITISSKLLRLGIDKYNTAKKNGN